MDFRSDKKMSEECPLFGTFRNLKKGKNGKGNG
jgi:hypothetical protein